MRGLGALVVSGLLLTALNAASIQQAKRLKYADQTEENIRDYRAILEGLARQEDPEALVMLAEAYESGSHWDKDIDKAVEYYEVAAKYGSETALLRLGRHYAKTRDIDRSKHYYDLAWKAGRSDAIKPLLGIAIVQDDKASIETFAQQAKEHNIELDEMTTEKIQRSLSTTTQKVGNSVMSSVEDATFEGTKTYIEATMKTLISLEGAYKNLGYKVDEYLIHNGLEPTIEIVLSREPTFKIDEEMAFFIAGENALRKAILGILVWANKMRVFLEKDLRYTVSGLEIEVGSSATAKLVTEKL